MVNTVWVNDNHGRDYLSPVIQQSYEISPRVKFVSFQRFPFHFHKTIHKKVAQRASML